MNFNLAAPCSDCPFMRVGGIRLTPERAEEIAAGMLDSQGHTFACHKTTGVSGEVKPREKSHCAGALIFAEKNGNATQMMRICERIGIYDARKLMGNAAAVESVFDSLDEMIDAQCIETKPHRKRY